MLEVALRKLVREEAAAAAIEGVGAMKAEMTAAVREIGQTEFVKATTAIQTYVRSHVAAPNRLSRSSRCMATIDGTSDWLVRARLRCLELALANDARTTDELTLAGRYADFVIDGLLAADESKPPS